jgi:hypothetical protein
MCQGLAGNRRVSTFCLTARYGGLSDLAIGWAAGFEPAASRTPIRRSSLRSNSNDPTRRNFENLRYYNSHYGCFSAA